MTPALSPPLPTAPFRTDLARWRQLAAPAWLARLLAGQPVPAAPAPGWRLLEVGCGEQARFLACHLPGAAYLDTSALEQAPTWNKVDDAALLAVLLAYGIDHATTVIVYGRNPLAAARAAHLMLYAGVADVRLLDGGMACWLALGLPTTSEHTPAPAPAAAFGAPMPARPHYLIGMRQARALLNQEDAVLVSTRTWNEYIGQTSGYSYIRARGDIAGARWGRAGGDTDVNSMSEFHHADGSMRPAHQIAQMWARSGITAEQRVAFYCGTGWRASLAFFYAWLMGWDDISVYDGGWCEWSAHAGNPVVRRCEQAELDALEHCT